MSFLDKLERKIGWLAIPNLVFYILIGNVMVYILQMMVGNKIIGLLSFHLPSIIQGQVWRVISFIFIPPVFYSGRIFDVFIAGLVIFFYYSIGRDVERAMGTFAFTIFYLLGAISVIVLGCIFPIPLTGGYLNSTLFFAYAYYFSDRMILFMFFIPIKVKYLAYVGAAFLGVQFILTSIIGKLIIFSGILNFIIFFGKPIFIDNISRIIYKKKMAQRRSRFKVYSNGASTQNGNTSQNSMHHCEVCGRTELDDSNLEFRYCSQCDGYHEYCMEHLHNHEHKKSSDV